MNYYFHWPFCRRKCGYCAFYSLASPTEAQIDAYLEELAYRLKTASPLPPAETIYFGGGTPTLPDCRRLERFFNLVFSSIRVQPGCEITMEANPETLDKAKIALLRERITRLSLGVQSFDPEVRQTLGRDCSQTALERALEQIGAAKFPHFNCDLIYAVPGTDPDFWERELERALALPVDHLSCYNLTREEGTRLAALSPVPDETAATMFELAGKLLAANGMPRYEISNYAHPGGECRHNLEVWRGGLLTGFGPAAAGFDGTARPCEPASLEKWLRREPPERDELPHESRLNEIFAVNLRTVAGWTPQLWSAVPRADAWERRLELASQAAAQLPPGLLEVSQEVVRLSESGLLFWDEAAQLLL